MDTSKKRIYVDPVWSLQEEVYLKTDPDQRRYIVTAIHINIDGSLTYNVSHNTETYIVFAQELVGHKNYAYG
jgi:hypothetical protein